MNREIKFRVYDYSQCEWLYGRFDTSSILSGKMTISFFEGEDSGFLDVSQQFTGLQDKYGTNIYEGDIAATPQWGRVQIVSDSNTGAFMYSYRDINNHCVTNTLQDIYTNREFEVIGNIHETPHLVGNSIESIEDFQELFRAWVGEKVPTIAAIESWMIEFVVAPAFKQLDSLDTALLNYIEKAFKVEEENEELKKRIAEMEEKALAVERLWDLHSKERSCVFLEDEEEWKEEKVLRKDEFLKIVAKLTSYNNSELL